jgi:chromosome partitioning protein
MAIILSVANQKGGSGKTTTAEQIAVELASVGYRVHVIDMDPQASFTQWYRLRTKQGLNSFSVQTIPTGLLQEDLHDLKRRSDIDIVLIDCPGNIVDITMAAVAASDAVLTPVRATGLDINATKQMISFVVAQMQKNQNLRFMIFHNAKHASRRLDKEANDSLTLVAKPVPGQRGFILKTAITDTAAVAEASMTGLSVREYAPKSPSSSQYKKLIKEILECLRPTDSASLPSRTKTLSSGQS